MGVRPQTILFDLDGTLVDSAPDMIAALWMLQDEESAPRLPWDTARSWVSHGTGGVLAAAFADVPQQRRDALQERLIALYAERMTQQLKLFPGMAAVLDAIDGAGRRWGVVTNKAARFSQPILAALGLAERCATLVSGDTTPWRKPHPGPLCHALDAMGASAASTMYVGDDVRDIAAGRAAGLTTVAALYGYIAPGQEPGSWGADYCISQPVALLDTAGLDGTQAAP